MKFRKRPVVIDAWKNELSGTPCEWLSDAIERGSASPANSSGQIVIQTREGRMIAELGDWIIRGVAGEFYPCKTEIFAATYDPVTGEE